MLSIGFLGFYTFYKDGFGFRFTKIVQELTDFKYDRTRAFRSGTCFLEGDSLNTAFKNCETPTDKQRSLILWGDSFAAQLYAGYKSSFGNQYNIIQRTIGGCPPILDRPEGSSYERCNVDNKNILDFIMATKLDKVVLAANWNNDEEWEKIAVTVTKLQEIGITNIDLVGNVPLWTALLSKLLYSEYQSDPFHRVPYRLKSVLQKPFDLDPRFASLSEKLRVNYISPIKILCNEDGCITRFGETGDSIESWDGGAFDGGCVTLFSI